MRAPSYSLQFIPAGRDGIRATLQVMSNFVTRYKTNPQIFELTRRVVLPVRGKAYADEARAVLDFVRGAIRYTKDVAGVETVQSPIQTLRLKTGDCDDMSVLVAAMLASIGHPTRFIAVGFMRNSFSHVYPETRIGNRWVAMEPTMNWPLGQKATGVREKMEHHNP